LGLYAQIISAYKAFDVPIGTNNDHKRLNPRPVTAFDVNVDDVQSVSSSTDSNECNEGIQYASNFDILSVENVESASDCRNKCQTSFGCSYWSYGTAHAAAEIRRTCILKSFGAAETAKVSEGVISGPRDCSITTYHTISTAENKGETQVQVQAQAQEHVFSDSCIHAGVMYKGSDIGQGEVGVANAELCQRICQATPKCEYWSYISSTNSNIALRQTCFLKSREAAGHGQRKLGVKSGPARCKRNQTKDMHVPAPPSPLPTYLGRESETALPTYIGQLPYKMASA
jgi:hypothetical protein